MHCAPSNYRNKELKVNSPRDDKSNKTVTRSDDSTNQTSGNREESAAGADEDAFGKQNPASSGTTPLGKTSADDKPGPGGVEGTGGGGS